MLLSLKNEHKQCLAALAKLMPQILKEHCSHLLDYFEDGNIDKFDNSTDQNVCPEVKAIFNLLLECNKLSLRNDEFGDCAAVLGFKEEQINILKKVFETCSKTLKFILHSKGPHIEHFVDLHWRFEAQVASRYLSKHSVPVITMKLFLSQENLIMKEDLNQTVATDDKKKIIMQTDINSLLKVINILERALQEGKSQRVHSITRALT